MNSRQIILAYEMRRQEAAERDIAAVLGFDPPRIAKLFRGSTRVPEVYMPDEWNSATVSQLASELIQKHKAEAA